MVFPSYVGGVGVRAARPTKKKNAHSECATLRVVRGAAPIPSGGVEAGGTEDGRSTGGGAAFRGKNWSAGGGILEGVLQLKKTLPRCGGILLAMRRAAVRRDARRKRRPFSLVLSNDPTTGAGNTTNIGKSRSREDSKPLTVAVRRGSDRTQLANGGGSGKTTSRSPRRRTGDLFGTTRNRLWRIFMGVMGVAASTMSPLDPLATAPTDVGDPRVDVVGEESRLGKFKVSDFFAMYTNTAASPLVYCKNNQMLNNVHY